MKKTFEIEWPDSHGPDWLNIDNLKSCLFGEVKITSEGIKVTECRLSKPVSHKEDETERGTELDEIRARCLDSKGYLIFAAVLTNKRDGKGFNLIDHKYRRYHFSFEDVKMSFDKFKELYNEDVGAT